MTIESAAKFFKLLAGNETLRKRMHGLGAEQIVAIGKEQGHVFTTAELLTVCDRPLEALELSDLELDQVAGGRKKDGGVNTESDCKTEAPGDCSLGPTTKISSCQLTICVSDRGCSSGGGGGGGTPGPVGPKVTL